MNTFTITQEDAGRTLLKYLQRMFDHLPVSRIERALREKDIKVNGERVKDKNLVLSLNDELTIYGLDLADRKKPSIAGKITFSVVYEDANILVVTKPNGLSMHSEGANSLDAQVLKYLNFEKKDSFVPSSIGRIDKVTSGIVVFGKTYKALVQLNDKQAEFTKTYQFKSDFCETKTITVKLKHDENLQKEVVAPDGKDATTKFFCNGAGTNKVAELVTGRKHQIRATLAHLGSPILGDTKYDGKRATRVFLHSYKIKFNGLEEELAYLNGKELSSEAGWN